MASSYENPEMSSLNQSKSISKKSSYGAIRKETPSFKQTVNIKHEIVKGETLQGISLKYGISVQSIKKLNKLWTDDLALIKSHLLIPIPIEKLSGDHKILNGQGIPVNSDCDTIRKSQNTSSLCTNDNENSFEDDTLIVRNDDVSSIDGRECEKTSYRDYLNKFDSFLIESKVKLKDLEKVNSLKNANNDDLFKTNTKRLYDNHSAGSSSDTDLTKTPDFVIKQNDTNSHSTYRAKQAYETLQKLEKEKDDLYEL